MADSPIQTDSPNQDKVRVISPEGHLRMGEKVDWLRAEVETNLREGHPCMVVDMSRVISMDSSAIGVLVRSLTLSRQKGGTVKLAAVPAKAELIMTVTGVIKLFETFGNAFQALESFA